MLNNTYIKALITTVLTVVFLWLLHLTAEPFLKNLDQPNLHLRYMNKGYRIAHYTHAVCGLQQGDLPLLQCVDYVRDGKQLSTYLPMEAAGDDLGAYLIIPYVSKLFDYQVLPAYYATFLSIVCISFFCFSFFFFSELRTRKALLFAHISLLIFTLFSIYILDVYVAGVLSVAITCFAYSNIRSKSRNLIIMAIVAGLILGICNSIRLHTGTGMLILSSCFLLLVRVQNLKLGARVLAILLLFLTSNVSKFSINSIIDSRNEIMLSKGFDPTMLEKFVDSHIVWHGIYLGLGYEADNPYGIKWLDSHGYSVGKKMAETKGQTSGHNYNPLNMRTDYEQNIKERYFQILKADPWFVIRTYLKKSWSCFWKFLIFFNLGIISLFLVKPKWRKMLPFGLTICFYFLPGIVTYPYIMYFISSCALGIILSSVLFDQMQSRKFA
ncbi:MAG: hypothetical protein MRY83_17265 [Flavobacteriales bacterium]|nr:hypothetical protein [Flavobacteriales bacterium]